MKRLALILSLFFMASSASGNELASGWHRAESGVLIHSNSGFAFPLLWEGMIRGAPNNFDAEGRNVAIGYNKLASHLALTLYLYPPSFGGVPDPEHHFRAVVNATLQAHHKARVERAARIDLPLGDITVQGYNAFIHWPAPKGQVGSFLVLIPQKKRFLKVRVTFRFSGESGSKNNAWEILQEFLRMLTISPVGKFEFKLPMQHREF